MISNLNERPPFIYKYKAISTKEDIVRLIDIINNHRIYMPNYSQLNDPLEGEIVSISVEGYAGMSIYSAADKEDIIVKQHKNNYRILSLAQEYDNAQLWAHYANLYEGVCLCFSTEVSFSGIKAVDYCKYCEELYADDENAVSKGVERSFLKKNIGWNYENEWRIVKKSENNYLEFGENELRGIIFGHKISNEIIEFIISIIDPSIILMKTDIGYRSFRINVLPIEYQYELDGTPIRVLDVERSLKNREYHFVENS